MILLAWRLGLLTDPIRTGPTHLLNRHRFPKRHRRLRRHQLEEPRVQLCGLFYAQIFQRRRTLDVSLKCTSWGRQR